MAQPAGAQVSAIGKFQHTERMFELSGASDIAMAIAGAMAVRMLTALQASNPDIADHLIEIARKVLMKQIFQDMP
jgi:hypothetical protein